MSNVTVVYLGMIQRVAGTRQETVALDHAATLGDLVRRLGERHGPEFVERILEGDRLAPLVTVLIDGGNCLTRGGPAAPLGGGEEIEVVLMGPPPSGG